MRDPHAIICARNSDERMYAMLHRRRYQISNWHIYGTSATPDALKRCVRRAKMPRRADVHFGAHLYNFFSLAIVFVCKRSVAISRAGCQREKFLRAASVLSAITIVWLTVFIRLCVSGDLFFFFCMKTNIAATPEKTECGSVLPAVCARLLLF